MNKPNFAPARFHRYWMGSESSCSPAQAAETAEMIFDEFIQSCPIVHGYQVNGVFRWDENQHPAFDTHVARIADVQKIESVGCSHPIIEYDPKVRPESMGKCFICGKKMKVKLGP